jgi:hypothetical protein
MTAVRAIVQVLTVFILLCNSIAVAQTKGTFAAGINYPAGPATVPSNTGYLFGGISPIEVHVGDFNGDGKADIVAAASCGSGGNGGAGILNCPASGNAAVVYLSNGDGTFQPGMPSGTISGLRSIAVGDFNGDGKLDIAAGSDCLSSSDCSSGAMVILLGNGDGTFTTGATYPLNGILSQANTIAIGDLNNDGKLDIVTGIACYNIAVNGCSVGAIEVFLGNGDGTFQTPQTSLTAGNNAIPVLVGDFNRDGKPDVAATPGTTLAFFPGNGDGTLGTPSSTPLPYGGQAITIGDFNSDGNLDVAVGGYFFAMVAFGNGDGTFQTPATYNLNNNFADSIVAADMNGDGKPDLIVGGGQGYSPSNTVTLLVNDGVGGFSKDSTFFLGSSGNGPASVGAADFNGDGKTDILLASQSGGSDGTLSLLLGNGDGTMRSAQYINENPNGTNPTVAGTAATGDFNGDGFQDLIFPSGCGPGDSCTPSGFTLLLSNGAGGYQAPLSFTAPVNGANRLAVADFNGDGKPDVAVFNNCDTSCTGTSVSVFLNTGNGTFSAPNVYEGGGVTQLAIVAGDFNGDGKMDIAVLNACDPSCSVPGVIGILLGNGDGTFQPVVTTSMPTGPATWIAGADFNSDGKTDLVVVEGNGNANDPYAGSAQILLSNGDGTFTFGNSYATGGDRSGSASGMAVTTGDVNGDGKADIVIGNLCEPIVGGQFGYDVNCANGAIGVLLGNGDGTFQYGPSYDIPDANFYSIALADVNGDGKLDYIASTATGVAVSFGNGDGSFQPPTVYAALGVIQNVQLAVADLNGDGGLDIVQPGSSGQLAILYNQGFSRTTPAVSLQSSLNPSTFGQTVTFTATVTSTSGTPTGTVTFFFVHGAATLPVALVNGSASYSANGINAGTYSIYAIYSGDSNNSASASAILQQVVNPASSTTTLISSANPTYLGYSVTLTATVLSQYGGSVSGDVTFKQGTTTLASVPLSNGQAVYSTTPYTTTGTRSITAVYSGDTNNQSSTSPVLHQAVDAFPAATTTVLTTSGSPSLIGQSVTLTAEITWSLGPVPNGETVNFFDGSTEIGSTTTNQSVAVFSTSALTAATHTIKATFVGDSTFKTSSGTVKQVVNKYPSTTALSSNLNPSIYGQSVILTAQVTTTGSTTPTGTVTFKNGTASLGTASLDGNGLGTLTKTNLPVGSDLLTATYNGDALNGKSTSTGLTDVVNQAAISMSLTSTPNPSPLGKSVKFAATFTSNGKLPTGPVTFSVAGTTLGTASIGGTGEAVFSTSALPAGSDVVTATYAGNADYSPATMSVTQLVNATTIVLTSSLNPSNHGQAVTLTAQVTTTGSTAPTGTVTFRNGANSFGTLSLNASGVAMLKTTTLPVGSDSLTASYNGDALNGKSTSAVVTQVVN